MGNVVRVDGHGISLRSEKLFDDVVAEIFHQKFQPASSEENGGVSDSHQGIDMPAKTALTLSHFFTDVKDGANNMIEQEVPKVTRDLEQGDELEVMRRARWRVRTLWSSISAGRRC